MTLGGRMNINLDLEQWEQIPAGEQENVQRILSKHFSKAEIVPQQQGLSFPIPVPDFPNPLCELACNATEAAVIAACSTVGGPLAVAACIAAARVAGDACRREC
jgi:hypothetical protein